MTKTACSHSRTALIVAAAIAVIAAAPAAPAKPPPTDSATAPSANSAAPSVAPATAATPAATAAPAAPAHPGASTAGAQAALLTGAQLIQLLDQTVDWYRSLGIQQQTAVEPRDQLVLYENKRTADQVVALAFQFAKANAQALGADATSDQAGADSGSSQQTYLRYQRQLDAQGQTLQRQLEGYQHQLTSAHRGLHGALEQRIAALQGEIDLVNAKKSLITTMSEFAGDAGAAGAGTNGLKAQIDAMAIAVPAANTISATQPSQPSQPSQASQPTVQLAQAAPASAAKAAASGSSAGFGIWDLVTNAFGLSERLSAIDAIDHDSAALEETFTALKAPFLEQLKGLAARGDALASAANSAEGASLNGMREQLEDLTGEFKRTSASLIPLSKASLLVGQFRRNLSTWRQAVKTEYRGALKTLAVRVGFLLALLAVVFVAAEFWRRAVWRFAQDTRRRNQLLLIRRIVLWFVIIVIVGIAFASELGAIVTFAGLITAGIAVAMQSVLVSIVGYFFLIGKYGIRVGDRVQIGEVTGEVIELGLVRLYLMELGGHGQTGPTGRVVGFANSIVFQVSSGLFKQIPGVSVAWHEIKLDLPAHADLASIKPKLLAAVNGALQDYRPEIIRQTQEIQKTTMSAAGLKAEPQVQLNFSASGVEAVVRYPVHSSVAAEIDEHVSRELHGVIAAPPR